MSNPLEAKRVRRLPILLVLIFVGLALAAGGSLYWLNQPPAEMGTSTVVDVHKGESFRDIAHKMQRLHLIKSALLLEGYSIATQTAGELKVGRYEIEKGATTVAIHDLLVSGRQLLVRVTIPEGWTLKQIAERLQTERIVDASDFLKAASSPQLLAELGIPLESAQGFLFPDTYLFPEHYPAEKVVRTMAADFTRHLAEIYPDYRSLTPQELARKVILASIVEGEYRIPREAPIIASVFYNRLKINMRLESCATVEYVLTDILGQPHQIRLYDKQLWVPSAYNTYRHRGLPPGPINEPGSVALRAAFYPANTKYLYFVVKDPVTGEHFFSESFAAHELAMYQYDNLYLKQY